MRQLHRSRRDIHQVVLARKRLDDRAETIEFARNNRLAQRSLGEIEPARLHIERRRHGCDLDLLLRAPLDVAHQTMFTRFGKRDRHAFASSAAGAADAMHIRLGR